VSKVREVSRRGVVGLVAIVAIGIPFAGCGSDDETTSSEQTGAATRTSGDSTGGNAETVQRIDSAVADCKEQADELSAIPAAALKTACGEVGDAFKRNLDDADQNVDQALTDAAKSCRDLAGNLPAGSASDSLSKLCDAIAEQR
jgi:hypothetical protein